MSSEVRAAAKALFREVIQLDDASRRRRLDVACQDQPQLLAEVEAMLAADSDDFLAQNAHELAGLHDTEVEETPIRSADGYELIREIGRGGMGVVYEARESDLGRRVALKFLLPGRLAPAESMRRFEGEIRTLARLAHPSIVPIYATGEAEGRPFFAMELVDGESLDRYVRSRKPSTEARLRLFVQACEAVSHAHQNGVIHRDLKPSNLLVVDGGISADGRRDLPRLRVLDFGLALMTDDDRSGMSPGAGTPAYMSPEQTEEQGDRLDVRSDIYSLGVILHELLVGELPYGKHDNPLDLLFAIRAAEFDPRKLIERGIDFELSTLVGKALRRDPAGALSKRGGAGR